MKIKELRKKTLSAILAAVMLLTLAPGFAVSAAEEVIISTAEELIALAYSSDESDFAKNYRMACDIDMSQAEDERPMKAIGSYSGGSGDIAFTGVFDGGGHKIINLSTAAEALFGYVGETGAVENLTLENASVHYRENSSSKYPAALVSLNRGKIQACFSVDSTVVSDYCVPCGGLVGTNFGTISQSGVYGGSVSLALSKFSTSVGGFTGNQRGGKIEECFSTAAIDAKKMTGGFVGKLEGGEISDCYALGAVSGTDENGGFAGAFTDDGVLKNSYAANDVSATSGGGLAGSKGGTFYVAGTPENCWYCTDFSAPQTSGSFENDEQWAKSAADMRTPEFAAALSDKWAYDADINGGYPYLINAAPPVGEKVETITVSVIAAGYDKRIGEFYKICEPFTTTVEKSTATVRDILDKAAEDGQITYAAGTGAQSGFIVSINGVTPKDYDGWMFTVNGECPPVGAEAAVVSEGDKILWYVGAPENGYTAPVWEEICAPQGEITLINSVQELVEIAADPGKWDGRYKLAADIDLSGVEFSPIGNAETPFSGSFDGNGFEISNLTVTADKDSQNIGMFGVILGARLKNVTLKNVNITGGSVVGGLAGIAKSEKNRISLISDCNISGSVMAVGTSYVKQSDVGGIAGVNDCSEKDPSGTTYASVIDGCTADVTVSADTGSADISEAGHVGGFVGLNKGVILNSASTGDVFGGNTTGGFVGSNYGGKIRTSYATGNVTGAYTTGGFAGSSGIGSLIENSYSTGDVTAADENGAYFGGFAGSVGGRLKNCISAGVLTPGGSYNGGFAGSVDGTVWSYNDELRSVSGCYGNSITGSGEKIKALGNYIGGIHAPTDMAAAEIGVDKETAGIKIREMLDNAIAENKLKTEAGKYKTSAVIPAIVQENSDITALVARLCANASADEEIALSYESDNDIISADTDGYTLKEKPEEDVRETVTLTFALNDAEYSQPITVSLRSAENRADMQVLLKNIAEEYASDSSDYWKVVTVSAYNGLWGGVEMTAKAKADFAANAAAEIAGTDKDTALAMDIIALRSLGYDPSRITAADGSKIDALSTLALAPSTGNNGDAYRLLAYYVCGYDDEAVVNEAVERLIAAQIDGKGWSNNNDNGIDADSTGAVILGLSPYYAKNAAVRTAVDGAVEYLSSLMQTDGNIKSSYKKSNYGTNANTSAICAIGLTALGIDIKTDARFVKNSVSLFDGIMSFATEDETGFSYEYAGAGVNDFSTKQAAPAVMAAEKKGNIFDFSDMPKNPLNLKTSSGGGMSGGSVRADNSSKTIDVYFSLIGDTVHKGEPHTESAEWIKEIKLEVPENSTAREVIEKALSKNGYTVSGLDKGYISEITAPDGTALGEYSNGEQSGWMYMLNGETPDYGINDCKLKNGDRLKVYYSDSWENALFPDVSSDDWFYNAAEFAAQKGLIKGNENGEFMPDAQLTRAMAVTILFRYKGAEQGIYAESGFSDVSAEDWFAPAVGWAVAGDIVSGMGDNRFAPGDSITREQLALILYRLFNPGKEDNGGTIVAFADSAEVSDWAAEAMSWAVGEKLISGMGDGTLSPKSTATRAQFAMILMNMEK